MATFTLSIPSELKDKIDAHPEINWPEYIRQRLELRVREFRRIRG